MKNIVFILLLTLLFSSNVYSERVHHTNDMNNRATRTGRANCNRCNTLIRQFERKGIKFTEKDEAVIILMYDKTHEAGRVLDVKKREVDRKIAYELLKKNPNKKIIKELIVDKKLIEADMEYLLVEFDLYILPFLTKDQIILLNEEHHRSRAKRK